jgi:uncharacterized protein YqhQ
MNDFLAGCLIFLIIVGIILGSMAVALLFYFVVIKFILLPVVLTIIQAVKS